LAVRALFQRSTLDLRRPKLEWQSRPDVFMSGSMVRLSLWT
jgi:hypothetical protein